MKRSGRSLAPQGTDHATRHAASRSLAAGGKIDIVLYPGAPHDFDNPGRNRQSNPANSAALRGAMVRAIAAVDGLKD